MDTKQFFETFNYIFQGILGFAYIYTLTSEWRFSKKKVRILMVGLCLLFIAVSVALLDFMGQTQELKGCLFLIGLAIGVFFCLFASKYRDGRALFVCFSSLSFNFVCGALGEVVGSADTLARILTRIVICAVIFCFVYRYFRVSFNRLMNEMETGWYQIALVPLSLSLLCLSLLLTGQVYHNKNYKFIAVAMIFAIVCSYVALYHVFCILQEQYRLKSNYTLLNTQMDSLERQVQTLEEADRQMRIFRHDLRHYIALQQTCLENGDLGEARETLAQLEQTLEENAKKIQRYTESPYINAVIANYSEKAKADGIDFSVRLSEPVTVHVGHIELAVMISNALENAWKACRRIPEKEERRISVTGVQKQNQYLMEIANTCEGPVSFNQDRTAPVTAEKGHGYGVQSILAFAEKYHAFVDFKSDGKWFKVRVILS